MEERDILMQTIESLNASIQTLSESHKKEVDSLNARIKELTAQVAWLNRQLFGRKSEKLPIINPNQLDLFAAMLPENVQQISEARDEAVEKITVTKEERRQERKNRIMMEDLPATCRNHDVNPRDYLNDIISQMSYHAKAAHRELLQLLPHKWKLTHPESVMTKTA